MMALDRWLVLTVVCVTTLVYGGTISISPTYIEMSENLPPHNEASYTITFSEAPLGFAVW